MEEAWELAAVSEVVGNELIESVVSRAEKLQYEIDEIGKYFKRFSSESKYLIVANIAAIIFSSETLGIKLDDGSFNPQKLYMLPFLLGFIASSFAYWKSFMLDGTLMATNTYLRVVTDENVKNDAASVLIELKQAAAGTKLARKTVKIAKNSFTFSAWMFGIGILLAVFKSIGFDLFSFFFGLVK